MRIPDPTYPISFPNLKNQHLLNLLKSCLQRDPKARPVIEGENGLLKHPFLMPNTSSSSTEITEQSAPMILNNMKRFIEHHGCSEELVHSARGLFQAIQTHRESQVNRTHL